MSGGHLGKASVMRIGLLGASRIAAEAIIEPVSAFANAEVVAVASRDGLRAERLAAKYGVANAHSSYEALLARPDVDLVYVGTHPVSHAELAIAAANAGKSVLVEKPFAMNAKEALTVSAAGRRNRVKIMEAMHSRHHALFTRILTIIQSGELGEIVNVEAAFEESIPNHNGEFRWRADRGGGAIMDLGVYPLAWVRGAIGAEPHVVAARSIMKCGVDATTTAELLFPGGARGRIRCDMAAERGCNFLAVVGSRARLWVENPLAPQNGHRLLLTTGEVVREERFEAPSTFASQLAAVYATVMLGAPFTLPEGDYVASMSAIDAVRAASLIGATTGGEVDQRLCEPLPADTAIRP